jgi:hypothetical protein
MKGIVFTEFLDFVEDQMGADMVDAIIDDCELSTGGAYTSVGTYPFSELRDLLMAVVKRSGADPSDLLRGFGHKLCTTFTTGYGRYFDQAASLFDFLASIDAHIHVEVRKLYPDAELPSMHIAGRSEHQMLLDYRSERGLEALAEGLIQATSVYYREPVALSMAKMSDDEGRPFVRFTIDRQAA